MQPTESVAEKNHLKKKRHFDESSEDEDQEPYSRRKMTAASPPPSSYVSGKCNTQLLIKEVDALLKEQPRPSVRSKNPFDKSESESCSQQQPLTGRTISKKMDCSKYSDDEDQDSDARYTTNRVSPIPSSSFVFEVFNTDPSPSTTNGIAVLARSRASLTSEQSFV